MSDVKWCDKEDHPFSVLEIGWQSMTVKESYEDSNGNMQSRDRRVDVCAKHGFQTPTNTTPQDAITDNTATVRNRLGW